MDFVEKVVANTSLKRSKKATVWMFVQKIEGFPLKPRKYVSKRRVWLNEYFLEGIKNESGTNTVTLKQYDKKKGTFVTKLRSVSLNDVEADNLFCQVRDLWKSKK